MKRTLIELTIALTATVMLLLASLSAQIGYKSAADAEQKKTLLLKDFHPKSMLHVKETPCSGRSFP